MPAHGQRPAFADPAGGAQENAQVLDGGQSEGGDK
jgi:hypothetical protein